MVPRLASLLLNDDFDVSELPDTLGRRSLLAFAAGAFALGANKPAAAQAGQGEASRSVTVNWTNPALRLARRISYGTSATEAGRVKALGFTRYLEEQLAYENINDSACENAVTARWPRVNMTVRQLKGLGEDWITANHWVEASLFRAAKSKRQLYHRMVEFWSDHFNVWMDAVPTPIFVAMQRDAIQKNAMGNFKTLLRSVCFSPAMLAYLNNDANFCSNPNVNFARELMELHTLGVDGGYAPDDILSVSLAFTGWRWQRDWNRGDWGTYLYDHTAHSVGRKLVLDQIVPNGARDEGERVIDILFNHPSCSKFIAKKLAKFFLGKDAPQTVIDAAAAEFRRTGGNIRAVLRKILTQANVQASPAKYKRPLHYVVSGLRSMDADLSGDLWNLRWIQLGGMGQYPHQWETPDGYPDRFEFWSPSVSPRLDYAFQLGNNRVWGVVSDIPTKIGNDRDPDRVLTILNNMFFGGEMGTGDRDALEVYLRGGLLTDERLRGAATLCLASPSFQWA